MTPATATDMSSTPPAAIAAPPMAPALKEWAVAVEALIQGSTVLLLRKGGSSGVEGNILRVEGGDRKPNFQIARRPVQYQPS